MMPATRAFPFLYWRVTRFLDDDVKLEIDAVLGDPDAIAEVTRRKLHVVTDMGIEVG